MRTSRWIAAFVCCSLLAACAASDENSNDEEPRRPRRRNQTSSRSSESDRRSADTDERMSSANDDEDEVPSRNSGGSTDRSERSRQRAEGMTAIQRQLLETPDFQAWVVAVSGHRGWRGDDADKANPNRVRVHGVYWTPTTIVAVLPRRAMTVDEDPLVEGVNLEFEHGSMTKWEFTLPGSDVDNADFYIWSGSRAPKRFQFSFVMDDGPNRWG